MSLVYKYCAPICMNRHTICQLDNRKQQNGFCPIAGREIAPNTGASATKFFTLATKS